MNILEGSKDNAREGEMNSSGSSWLNLISRMLLYFFLAFSLALIIVLLIYKEEVLNFIFTYEDWIRNNLILSLLIVFICEIIGCFLALPSIFFEFTAGFIFSTYFSGNYIGLVFSIILMLTLGGLSGLLVFNFSSWALKGVIRSQLIEPSDKMKKFECILKIYGTRALFLIRLTPFLPISIYNYLMGGFTISNSSFFYSSYGSFLIIAFWCYLGFSAGNQLLKNSSQTTTIVEIVLYVVGFVILIVLSVIFSKISSNVMNDLNSEPRMDEEQQNPRETVYQML